MAHLLDYCATKPDAKSIFQSRDMVFSYTAMHQVAQVDIFLRNSKKCDTWESNGEILKISNTVINVMS